MTNTYNLRAIELLGANAGNTTLQAEFGRIGILIHGMISFTDAAQLEIISGGGNFIVARTDVSQPGPVPQVWFDPPIPIILKDNGGSPKDIGVYGYATGGTTPSATARTTLIYSLSPED